MIFIRNFCACLMSDSYTSLLFKLEKFIVTHLESFFFPSLVNFIHE